MNRTCVAAPVLALRRVNSSGGGGDDDDSGMPSKEAPGLLETA